MFFGNAVLSYVSQGPRISSPAFGSRGVTFLSNRCRLDEHRFHAEVIHRHFVEHFVHGAPLLPSRARHVEQLSIQRSSLVLVPRSRPEDARCMDLCKFPMIASQLSRSMSRLAKVESDKTSVESVVPDCVIVRASTRIHAELQATPAYVLVSQTESALSGSRPRRLLLTLCYDDASPFVPIGSFNNTAVRVVAPRRSDRTAR